MYVLFFSFLYQFARSFGWAEAPNWSEVNSIFLNMSFATQRATVMANPSAHASGVPGSDPHSQFRSASSRSRDLIDTLPLFETVSESNRKVSSRRNMQRFRRKIASRKIANDGIRAIQALSRGSVKPSSNYGEQVRTEPNFRVSRQAEELGNEFLSLAQQFLDRHPDCGVDPVRAAGADALSRLTREGLIYSVVNRGDLVRADLARISLPQVQDKIFAADVGGVVSEYLQEWEHKMLRDPPPSDAEVLSIGSYGDASFHGKTLVHLGVLLWKAGMIRGCSKKILFGIRMFCVHKKTVVEDFSSVDLQRLIFDLRRVNLFFQSPPPCAMGSLSALAGVDLSDRELERISRRLKTEPGAPRCDAEVVGIVGDVPDVYYRILNPPELTGYFWIEGLSPLELYNALAAEGIHAPELLHAEAVGVCCICMGWNWAPWISQNLLETILQESVPEFSAENSLKHAHPPPDLQPVEKQNVDAVCAHLEYIDDFGGVVVQQRNSECAARILDSARVGLRKAGLDCHKEMIGAVIEMLGSEIFLNRRLILPKQEKFSLLVLATRHICAVASASPHDIEVVIGHWTHFALLQRLIFSVMCAVYAFMRLSPQKIRRSIPKDVLLELRTLVALAPFVRADLALEWSPEVSMVDAGPSLGAVVYASAPVETVAHEGRPGLVSGWLYTPQDAALPEALPSGSKVKQAPLPVPEQWVSGLKWRVGAVQAWLAREHNNISEGRCVVLAVSRLTRTRRGRRRKLLVITDSQVVLGTFRKGRSSSPGLLYLARRLAAFCLGYQVRIALRYVPSARNLADGPSRGLRYPSVAPETLNKASKGRSARVQRFDSTKGYPGEGPPRMRSAGRGKAKPPPLKNRGKSVWDHVARVGMPPGRVSGGANLLHVHAVNDQTNVRNYLPAVDEFLREARRRKWPLDSFSQRDAAIADLLAIMCYEWNVGIQRGRLLFHGFLHVFPEHSDLLPEAHRALQSWERLGTENEGEPIPEEQVWCIVLGFLRSGNKESALISALSFDCFLRGQDWKNLRVSHIKASYDRSGRLCVALIFGERALGESVKTGSDQGCIVQREWLAQWLLRYRDERIAQGKIFVFEQSSDAFRDHFAAIHRWLGIAVATPHVLRHAGAAVMLEDDPSALPVAKRRGRWLSDRSLKRYSKTHILVALRGSLPPAILQLGQLFIADPEAELARATANDLSARRPLNAVMASFVAP